MVEFIFGLGLALPIATTTSISTVTGVAQGVTEQKKHNADLSNQRRMLKFHLDAVVESKGADLDSRIVTLRRSSLWLDRRDPRTGQPLDPSQHPFTGFYVEYPDNDRPYTRGLVSTISRDPPMLNWIYIDKSTLEVKYSNRSGSIAHHVGSFDWTSDSDQGSNVTFDGWEGFLAVQQGSNQWALYFDLHDDGLAKQKSGRDIYEVSLMRRIIPAQEVNKWGLVEHGNIGFKATKEVDKLSEQRRVALERKDAEH